MHELTDHVEMKVIVSSHIASRNYRVMSHTNYYIIARNSYEVNKQKINFFSIKILMPMRFILVTQRNGEETNTISNAALAQSCGKT
jgi:hypothetical protein